MASSSTHHDKASAIEHANKGAGEIRTQLDVGALKEWLEPKLEGVATGLEVAQFNGGQSNPTYRLTTPRGRYVLRRKPAGDIVKGAHDVLREARIQRALAQTNVPVAPILAVCEDRTIIGSEFYIMQMIEGRVIWDAAFREVPREQRSAYFEEMNRVISELHAVDREAVGLADYGPSGNYFDRQLRRWSKQYLADEIAGRNPDMDALLEWLPTVIPHQEETTIVHGDFRCDNLIFHPTEPRILAVLDWELSTLGHPLADFSYHAMMYRMPPDIVAGLGGADPIPLGLPSEATYVEKYCRRTGREGISDWDFHMAFQFFRLAAIFHGIKGRVLRGTASNAQAALRAEAFPRLARLGREAMEACR